MPIYLANIASISTAEIAIYSATASLPWAFKFLAGPFMDRYTFLPMGFRRPYVIGAKYGLVLSMLLFAVVAALSPSDSPPLWALALCAFLANTCSSSMDVAVDGLAIDILPEDERGRANAFMAFGQRTGGALFGHVCGVLMTSVSLWSAGVFGAVIVAVLLTIAIVCRERPGERLMPWSEGQASDVERVQDPTFRQIGGDLFKVLFMPMSLVLIAMELFSRLRDGFALTIEPEYAADILHIATPDYTLFNMIMGLAAAGIGILFGPMIDKRGARLFLFWALISGALLHLFMYFMATDPSIAQAVHFGVLHSMLGWADEGVQLDLYYGMVTMYIGVQICSQLIFVALIAIFMTVCWTRVAATQFAIYMSLSNLCRTLGGWILAAIADDITLETGILFMAGFMGISGAVVLLFNIDSHKERLARIVGAQSPNEGAASAKSPG